MKKSFLDAQEVKIEPSDRAILEALSRGREWPVLRRIVEDYILQLTYNLVAGTESENGSSIQELNELRGFTRYWKNKIVRLVESKETHKKDEAV